MSWLRDDQCRPAILGPSELVGFRGLARLPVRRDRGFDDDIKTLSIRPNCIDPGRSRHVLIDFADNCTRETYKTVIQYSVVPEAWAVWQSLHTDTATFGPRDVEESHTLRTGVHQDPPDGSLIALQEFTIGSSDHDRFLGRFSVMSAGRSYASVVFRDGDSDRARPPVTYRVGFVGLDRAVMRSTR